MVRFGALSQSVLSKYSVFLCHTVAFIGVTLVAAWPLPVCAQEGGTKDKDKGKDEKKEDTTNPPYHVEHITSPTHKKGISWPPKGSVWPPEQGKPPEEGKEGKWPTPSEHQKTHTFPPHWTKATWPPYDPNGGWPSFNDNHAKGETWPPYHVEGYTWPPHKSGLTWYPKKSVNPPQKGKEGHFPPRSDHKDTLSFPPSHKTGKTFPEHHPDFSWEEGGKGGFLPPEHSLKEQKTQIETAPPMPATDRSETVLAGKPQVFVAGEVSTEEPMLVTVRGPNSFGGVVVSVEADGKKIEARPDQHGHSRLELAALAAELTTATVATVHVTDATGREITTARTKIVPPVPGGGPKDVHKEVPVVPGGVHQTRTSRVISQGQVIPQIPNLPPLLHNGDVVTITGHDLGSEAQLIVGNRAQETLAASSKEIIAFMDAPGTGPQPAYVLTPNGASAIQTVHCYNFTVQLSQNTIARGQHITAVASYEGLPPGSVIKLSNASTQIVSMKVLGRADNQGAQSLVTVSHSNGAFRVDLMGQTDGPFVINYEVIPPPGMRTSP